MSKPITMREQPECPHCHAKNPPPIDRYEVEREMPCVACRKRYLVRTHLRYSVEPLEGDAPPIADDFIAARATDHYLPTLALRIEATAQWSQEISPKDRNAKLWDIFQRAFPFIEKLRDANTHSFTLLQDNHTIRVYHPKGCECPDDQQKPV